METWEKITDKHIQRKLANIYQSKWRFHPSVKVFPGIYEPVPSLTYQISHVFQQGSDQYKALLSDLCFQSKQAFCRCIKSDEWIHATDVFHYDYYFRPSVKFEAKNPDAWKVSLFPNGEYSIFVLHSGQEGFFGHPWEQTISIFGASLVEAYSVYRPKMFQHLIRKDGKVVAKEGPRTRAG